MRSKSAGPRALYKAGLYNTEDKQAQHNPQPRSLYKSGLYNTEDKPLVKQVPVDRCDKVETAGDCSRSKVTRFDEFISALRAGPPQKSLDNVAELANKEGNKPGISVDDMNIGTTFGLHGFREDTHKKSVF